MPPAFNLSQDQTLQFDHVKAKLILTLNLIPQALRPERQASSFSVSTSFVLEPNTPAKSQNARSTTSTHTYRLQIVKEQRVYLTAELKFRSARATTSRCLAVPLWEGSRKHLLREEVKL